MWRWHKIHESFLPSIVEDYNDNCLYTLKVQDNYGRILSRRKAIKKIKRNNDITAFNSTKVISSRWYTTEPYDVKIHNAFPKPTWEGHFGYDTFRSVIMNNIACVKLHKVNKVHLHSPDLVVMFLTGEWNDIFLVCSKDLMKWDEHEAIKCL